MPAMHFHLRWPDGSEMRCYSPSLVIQDHFNPGTAYPLPAFLQHCRQALHAASDRVRAKYGFACSMALNQLALIEQTARRFDDQTQVQVLRFDDDGG